MKVVSRYKNIVEVFGKPKEIELMGMRDEQDEVILSEPILPKKDVKVQIDAAEKTTWTVKDEDKGGAPGYEGKEYDALKLTLTIKDESVQTEHENSRPRLTIEHQFNIVKYPYLSKKTGEVQWLGRQHLYGLEEALGFEPVFVNGDGQEVEAHVTRSGRKVAPKGEGIKRKPNPDFMSAYFDENDNPSVEFAEKVVYADIGVERSEQFGDRNVIQRYKRPPTS